MNFSNTFCSSPWFHLGISHDGSFSSCRWMNHKSNLNIKTTTLIDYVNSLEMKKLRHELLLGKEIPGCQSCYYEDKFDKISGRTKQLLKSGIKLNDFTNSFLSSPHLEDFKFSYDTTGETKKLPVDLQLYIGNICNSGCIMCDPKSSTKLTKDYVKLAKISNLFLEPAYYENWTENPIVFNNFLQSLEKIPDLKYIHLLGGETLYNKAFYKICSHLIEHDISKNIILGTTTNGTIYSTELEKIISNFKEFHLGISIEANNTLNDYIRYPSNINTILDNIDKFCILRDKIPGLFITLRITPNVFSVYYLDQLIEYAIKKNLTLESCNILNKPSALRIELIPEEIRSVVKEKLIKLVEFYKFKKFNNINIRNFSAINQTNADTVLNYLDFVNNYTVPDDVEKLRFQLVEFVKAFESLRHNKILDYIPEYEQFLRTYGY